MSEVLYHAWEISDRPGVRLCIGRMPGRARPCLWLTSIADANGQPAILAQFHGEKHMQAAVNFLDTLCDSVQRAIDFHQGDNPQ